MINLSNPELKDNIIGVLKQKPVFRRTLNGKEKALFYLEDLFGEGRPVIIHSVAYGNIVEFIRTLTVGDVIKVGGIFRTDLVVRNIYRIKHIDGIASESHEFEKQLELMD